MAQTYQNHRRWVPMYHFVSAIILLATLIGSIVNLIGSIGTEGLYSASLLLTSTFVLTLVYLYTRTFALKAQDRAIRAEENLRYFALTGQLLDPKLDTRQVVGLRFAADDEFVELAGKAAAENMKEDDIKKAIKKWRPDEYRV